MYENETVTTAEELESLHKSISDIIDEINILKQQIQELKNHKN